MDKEQARQKSQVFYKLVVPLCRSKDVQQAKKHAYAGCRQQTGANKTRRFGTALSQLRDT